MSIVMQLTLLKEPLKIWMNFVLDGRQKKKSPTFMVYDCLTVYSKLSTLLLIQQSVKHNPRRSGKEG